MSRHTGGNADLHTLTGAYAVNAVSGRERAAFERHLEVCASCAQEVRELTATAERLGLAVAATAPPEMKEQVLRRIATVRQEPPAVGRQARHGGGGGSGAAGTGAGRSVPRFVLAACVAAAAAFGGVAVWQQQQLQDARQETRQVRQHADTVYRVLAAPDAASNSAKLGGAASGATGTVVVSRGQDRAVFIAEGMPSLPGDKVYQLWFDDGGTMRSAGLVPRSGAAGASGATGAANAVIMQGKVGHASGMGITVEPAGGSAQPTTQPLALMRFGSA